ncbi:LysR family transcriptional regulator [Burkholderia cepacia]|uniref:LysR family transcriptional regulator n=1 Tax=Burkholderia contaminans TaxID=488447 RepID=A0A3N8RNP9_9BURK|nr:MULTISPECIES: LysR family transcriptional regulator [Burkholderia cepacia complex]KVE85503.1 hypothetical protein WI99_16670 [Burkholderia cepacia]RQT37454.1 LysR family transcriptional regulator [Burkholderia contaminans]RRA19444.1 LysR family transcriptional regulator [Burkholderia cepacia]
MDITTLQYFLAVAKTGSFSRASVVLGMAQPSLSRQIRKLEIELQNELFYRHGRGVTLTDAGEHLRATAETVMSLLGQVERDLVEAGSMPRRAVTLGVPPSIGATLCSPVALRYAEAAPESRLRIREGFSSTLSDWIEEGTLDVAVMYDTARDRNLNAAPLLLEDLFLIQNIAMASEAEVQLEDLRNLPIVAPAPENGLRRVVDRAAALGGFSLNVVMEVDSVPALRQLAGAGVGAAILPFGAVHREVRMGRLSARRIACSDMRALLVAATPLNRPISSSARLLLRIIHSEALNFVSKGVLRGTVDCNFNTARQDPHTDVDLNEEE